MAILPQNVVLKVDASQKSFSFLISFPFLLRINYSPLPSGRERGRVRENKIKWYVIVGVRFTCPEQGRRIEPASSICHCEETKRTPRLSLRGDIVSEAISRLPRLYFAMTLLGAGSAISSALCILHFIPLPTPVLSGVEGVGGEKGEGELEPWTFNIELTIRMS